MSERKTEPEPPTSVDVDALARRLPRREPSYDRSRAMRQALLEAAEPPVQRGSSRWWVGGAALAAAAAGLWIATWPRAIAPNPPIASVVPAAPSAPNPAHELSPGPPSPLPIAPSPAPRDLVQEHLIEGVTSFKTSGLVQLSRGGATITAPPGADFEVEVRAGDLVRITVKTGWVVVAGVSDHVKVVAERDSWTLSPLETPPARPAPIAPPPRPAPARPPVAAQRLDAEPLPAAPRPASPELPALPARDAPPARPTAPESERTFYAGLKTLLDGDAPAAIGALERACAVASDNQEDACYWTAVAVLRAGDRLRARKAFANVVQRWPSSTHAGEANLALGWLLLDAGDRPAARSHFAAALATSLPHIRADAERGMAAAR